MSSLDPNPESAENSKSGIEREMKLLVPSLPDDLDLTQFPHSEISQAYFHKNTTIMLLENDGNPIQLIYLPDNTFERVPVSNEQYASLSEAARAANSGSMVVDREASVRLRIKGDKMFQTIKIPSDLPEEEGVKSRKEIEFEIDRKQYQQLRKCIVGNIVNKTRYTLVDSDSFEVVCDVFRGYLDGLILVEAEAKGEKSFDKLELPSWLSEARNVSNIFSFSNEVLSKIKQETLALLLYGTEQSEF